MAKKEKAKDDLAAATPKAAGTPAAKIAPTAGAEPTPAPVHKHSIKIPKLQKKNNPHLPRRMKKAQKKAAALAQAKA
jgi:hypothetical protein